MRGERISWIDICRGIGIILVIYGHGLSANSFRYVIYSFHMPLFFFLSGVVFYHKKDQLLWPYVKKSAKNILLPYLAFALISFLIWLPDASQKRTLMQLAIQFLSTFYGNSNNGYLAYNNILWFLPCLFVVRIAFAWITDFTINTKKLFSILLIFATSGSLISLFFPRLKLPFGVETAMTGIVFYGLGYLWNKHASQLQKIMSGFIRTNFIFLISFTILFIFATLDYRQSGQQFDMRLNHLNNIAFFYIAASAGILASISASILLGKNILLEYIGKHTLVLFAFHLIMFSYITKFLRFLIENDIIAPIKNIPLTPLYVIISMVIILLINFLIKQLKFAYFQKIWRDL